MGAVVRDKRPWECARHTDPAVIGRIRKGLGWRHHQTA